MIAKDQFWGIFKDDCVVGQVGDAGGVAPLGEFSRNGAGIVQVVIEVADRVNVIGGSQEIVVSRASAKSAGAVPGGQRDGFVQEKQLGVVSGLHDFAVPILVGQIADDPGFVTPAGFANLLVFIVQDAAIAHEQAAGGVADDLGRGEDAILVGHWVSLTDLRRFWISATEISPRCV